MEKGIICPVIKNGLIEKVIVAGSHPFEDAATLDRYLFKSDEEFEAAIADMERDAEAVNAQDCNVLLYLAQGGEMFARRCSETGVGMQEGWTDGDAEYAATEEAAEKMAVRLGFDSLGEATEGEDPSIFWTVWEDVDKGDGWYMADGTYIDAPQADFYVQPGVKAKVAKMARAFKSLLAGAKRYQRKHPGQALPES